MELLKRFKEGDINAFETLFRQFQADVYGWIMQIVRDRGVAEDLTVETFWRIHKARAGFDPDAPFGAWARRIARNLAIDHIRTRRPEEELPEQLPVLQGLNPALRREMRDGIAHAFRRLPAKLQVAAALVLIEERSYEESALALGESVETIRMRVFRAVRMFAVAVGCWKLFDRFTGFVLSAFFGVALGAGIYEHFLGSGLNNIFRVAPTDWTAVFRVSVFLLVIIEVLGCSFWDSAFSRSRETTTTLAQ
jgi:RNA polymerase sigma-70 factor (ECF subfamily)